jgi:hypothetical protein
MRDRRQRETRLRSLNADDKKEGIRRTPWGSADNSRE